MIPSLLTGLETLLNKVLHMDTDSLARIQSLAGKSIQINITDWNFSFFILADQKGLQLLDHYHQQPDTMISGKLFGLIKTGAAKASTTTLFDESITISGDTKTGEAFRDILKKLDIDWEEQLSKIVGDTLAHPIAHHTKKFFTFSKHIVKSFGGNVSEYLHYESQQLPPRQAVENFIADVGQLRDDVDRMEARINRWIARQSIP